MWGVFGWTFGRRLQLDHVGYVVEIVGVAQRLHGVLIGLSLVVVIHQLCIVDLRVGQRPDGVALTMQPGVMVEPGPGVENQI